jgi:DNA-binding transcriptional regulator YiaG
LNQRDFARLIGTSPAAIRNWEQGRTRIPRMAKKLMHVVERHPDVLSELTEVDSQR